MRQYLIKVFEDFVTGSSGATAVTSADFDLVLASYENIAVHAVATSIQGTSPTLQVDLQTTGDGRNWVRVATLIPNSALINPTSLAGGLQLSTCNRRANLLVTIGGSSNPGARVQLYACGRGRTIGRGHAANTPFRSFIRQVSDDGFVAEIAVASESEDQSPWISQ